MKLSEFDALQLGDRVRHVTEGSAYTIIATFHDRVIAVRSMDITNPAEWEVVAKAQSVDTEHHK